MRFFYFTTHLNNPLVLLFLRKRCQQSCDSRLELSRSLNKYKNISHLNLLDINLISVSIHQSLAIECLKIVNQYIVWRNYIYQNSRNAIFRQQLFVFLEHNACLFHYKAGNTPKYIRWELIHCMRNTAKNGFQHFLTIILFN